MVDPDWHITSRITDPGILQTSFINNLDLLQTSRFTSNHWSGFTVLSYILWPGDLWLKLQFVSGGNRGVIFRIVFIELNKKKELLINFRYGTVICWSTTLWRRREYSNPAPKMERRGNAIFLEERKRKTLYNPEIFTFLSNLAMIYLICKKDSSPYFCIS